MSQKRSVARCPPLDRKLQHLKEIAYTSIATVILILTFAAWSPCKRRFCCSTGTALYNVPMLCSSSVFRSVGVDDALDDTALHYEDDDTN